MDHERGFAVRDRLELIACFLVLVAVAAAQDTTPSSPKAAGYLVPAGPPSTPPEPTLTNMVVKAEAEWELTFEWIPELGSTNSVTYPIRVQVPFSKDAGFVYIRARKVEVAR